MCRFNTRCINSKCSYYHESKVEGKQEEKHEYKMVGKAKSEKVLKKVKIIDRKIKRYNILNKICPIKT